MNYLIAVDGGGTKTQVLCTTESGEKVGEGLSGPTNLTATTPGEASFNLLEGIRQATESLPKGWQVTKIVMGLAGMDTAKEKQDAERVFAETLTPLNIPEIILVNDIVIAEYSGTDNENSVTLIAGTGSSCFGRNAAGQEVKVGGMDFLLTDQGSGYMIGLNVLRTAMASFDGLIEKTVLETAVCEYFKITTAAELKDVVYHPLLGKADVADLSKLCLEAVAKNDAMAQKILNDAVAELFLMISTVMRKLQLFDKQTDCVLVGGIAQLPEVSEELKMQLTKICPQVKIIFPAQAPVYGALKLALQKNAAK